MVRIVFGHSRSGKPITSDSDLDDLESFEEIFDSYAVLLLMASREYRRDKSSELVKLLSSKIDKFEKVLESERQMHAQREAISAQTSIDIRNYAENLLRPEFKVWK